MSTVTPSTLNQTRLRSDPVEDCMSAFGHGYGGLPGGPDTTGCYAMGAERRAVDDATHYIRTFGRGRIVADQRLGPWFQIDHDRAHTAKLDEAARYLESLGLAERHPTKGNPRNVRFIDKYATDR